MKEKYEPKKVVKTAPLTELEKPLNVSFAGSKKKVRRNKKKQIFVKCGKNASVRKRTEQLNQANSEKNQKQINHVCIQCHTNSTWLNYSICYECYIKNINEKKQKPHWVGGRLSPMK